MQTCRQIHRETELLLWKFNIYSFGDGKSLDRFVANTLSATGVSRLANLRISVKYVPENLLVWGKTLRSTLLGRLTGLEVLHLCLDRDVDRPSYRHELQFNDTISEARGRLMSPIDRFSPLPMKHATFLFKDNGNGKWHWTDQEKETLAEDILHCLLDPPVNTLEIAKKEAEEAGRLYQMMEDIKTSKR